MTKLKKNLLSKSVFNQYYNWLLVVKYIKMKIFIIICILILFSCKNEKNRFCIESIQLERFYEIGPSPDLITVRLNNFDKDQIKSYEKSFSCTFYKNEEKLFSTIDCGFVNNSKGNFLNINATYFIHNKISDTLFKESVLKDKTKFILTNDNEETIILKKCL